MSIKLTGAAWDLNIPSTEKMVLMCLCDFANDSGVCWPAISTIARKCSKSERTIQTALRWLSENGYYTRDERAGTSPVYHLDPRKICTPAEIAPPQKLRKPPQDLHHTPANSAPKPSMNHKEPPISCASDDAPLTADELVDEWNSLASQCGLAKVAKLTDSRRRRAKARLRQYPELDAWQKAFATIRKTPFLLGENKSGWRADFDFLLQDKSFTKLVEGSYGQAKPSG